MKQNILKKVSVALLAFFAILIAFLSLSNSYDTLFSVQASGTHLPALVFGGFGSANGKLNSPFALAVDSSGNTYVADTFNHRIQVFNSSGVFVRKFGYYGSANGAFNEPKGIAVDSSGNIYVADTDNQRVEIFNSSGVWQKTIGSYGTAVGQFAWPEGIFIDNGGNIFVADTRNNRIQKFDPTGTTVLLNFGTSGSGNGQFHWPAGLFVDSTGTIYVADTYNNRVQIFDSSGVWQQTIGNIGITAGTAAGQFNRPNTISVDSNGNIYVADTWNNRIQVFDSSGQYVREFGNLGTAGGQFDEAYGVVVDSSGYVYVADAINSRIQRSFVTGDVSISELATIYTQTVTLDITASEEYQMMICNVADFTGCTWEDFASSKSWTLSDGYGTKTVYSKFRNVTGDESFVYMYSISFEEVHPSHVMTIAEYDDDGANETFNSPSGIAGDSLGNIYLVDAGNDRIVKFNSSGTFIMAFGSSGTSDGQFDWPYGIFIDGGNNLYITDQGNNRVQKFNSSGEHLLTFGSYGTENGQLDYPCGISVDDGGNIYVADNGNNRIQKFDSGGTWLNTFGSSGTGDGEFDSPYGVSVDSDDNVYVSDYYNSRIEKFDSSGAYVMQFGSDGSDNGQFSYAEGVFVDGTDNVYVADTGNDRIQKFNSSGEFLMKLGSTGSADGQFSGPTGIFVDSSSAIFVVDSYNNRFQKFAFDSSPVLSTDSSLASLSVSGFTMSPVFNGGTTSYAGNADSSVGSVSFTPTTSFAGASISLNGVGITSGNVCQFNLVTGTNNVAILVTAEDGVTTTTYNIAITKAVATEDTPPVDDSIVSDLDPNTNINDTDTPTSFSEDLVVVNQETTTPYVVDPVVSDPVNPGSSNTVLKDVMSVLSTSISNIGKSISKISKDVERTVQELPISEEASQNITTATLALVAVTPVVSVGLGSSTMLAYILRFFSTMLALLGIGKKKRNCGLVYNSVTKEPLSNAVVRIYGTNGSLVSTEVTNTYGIFETNISSGQYSILVQANGYKYPSILITGAQDLPYENVYRGGTFSYDSSSSISYSIPVDPIDKSNTEYASAIARNRLINVSSVLLNMFIFAGLVFSIISYIKLNSILNLILLLVYTFLVVLGMIMRRQEKYKFGTVTDMWGNVQEGVELGLMEAEFNTLYAKRVTNDKGKYRFIVPGGEYKLVLLNSQNGIEDIREVIIQAKGKQVFAISTDVVIKRA